MSSAPSHDLVTHPSASAPTRHGTRVLAPGRNGSARLFSGGQPPVGIDDVGRCEARQFLDPGGELAPPMAAPIGRSTLAASARYRGSRAIAAAAGWPGPGQRHADRCQEGEDDESARPCHGKGPADGLDGRQGQHARVLVRRERSALVPREPCPASARAPPGTSVGVTSLAGAPGVARGTALNRAGAALVYFTIKGTMRIASDGRYASPASARRSLSPPCWRCASSCRSPQGSA
jgi:hypothetical protein